MFSIEVALEKVVNKKYYNKTKTFLYDINYKHKLFHNTEQLPFLIQKLEDNKVIILSGNPGVGKTTTAMMIANYFFNRKKCDILYLEERDYPETLALAEENRLIIVDDFWGQNFSPSIQSHSTFQREFQSILKYFTQAINAYLILISRDYIIKDVLNDAEYETKVLMHENKYIINIEDFSFEDKLRIFLNHLLFYDCDLSYVSQIKYQDNFEYLLNHLNYSPRHLDYFLKIYLGQDDQSSYEFFELFREYLDSPTSFWKEAFNKLNATSKLILLILLISSDPMDLESLNQSFNSIQADARQTLNVDIVPSNFRKELVKLEEFYISIEKDDYYFTTFIKFQSPGIKDFLLEFLKTDGYLWIKPIISNALFFNQLIFIFSTTDEEIDDLESDIHLFGNKINLDNSLKKILKYKLLSEFNNLHFSNYEEREFSDLLTIFHSEEEIKYLKLLQFNRLFDIELSDNKDVKRFIVGEVLKDIENAQQGSEFIQYRCMIYFSIVAKLVYPYLQIGADKIIHMYYDNINFSKEYDYLYEFAEIFPVEFKKFYNSNISQIKKQIKQLIFDDIDYYLSEDDGKIGIELDMLLHGTIEELTKKYKIRITKSFVEKLESTFEINFSYLLKEKKNTKLKEYKNEQEKVRKKYNPKSYESIINEYLPSEDGTYEPFDFLKKNKFYSYIKELKNSNSILFKFKENKLIFENICYCLQQNKIILENLNLYNFIDSYFMHYSNQIGIDLNILSNFYFNVYSELEQPNHYSITGKKLRSLLKNSNLNELTIEKLSPIIVPYKSWYTFSIKILEKYFLAKHIHSLIDGSDFKEVIIEHLVDDFEDNQILEFLQSINKVQLWESYIFPELDRLIENIDFKDEKSTVLSFIDFFKIEFELTCNKNNKTFETFSGSNCESQFENILSFCNIEFFTSDFEVYFNEEYHTDDTILKLGINTKVVKKLYQTVVKTIDQKESRSLATDESVTIFEIILFDFLQNDENYQIIKRVGMVNYVLQIIDKIKYVRMKSLLPDF